MPQETAAPQTVKIVAGGLALLGVLNIGRVVVQTAVAYGDWADGPLMMYLFLNAIPVAASVFLLPLAYQLVRGRSWAYITAIVLVTMGCVFGALMLLAALAADGLPLLGLVMFTAPVAVLLGLIIPSSVRAFFADKPAPASYPVSGL
ncbi:hypothetical protein Q0Z83_044500 [Actinoplanes sichuanensis]|uniref:Uncharacterized protein n=1 Tax=Actinoplanes sichuanensis TaxID=512349 RepID=A0ABW4APW1_9ACTN|nr:hypothetical protein [Actinoplanes sichuanensis]BEL06259.1 hypothetical protein Q0Z83_044500 [Actinoplanes sichuanensis]